MALPRATLSLAHNPDARPVADEAEERLRRALDSLQTAGARLDPDRGSSNSL